MATIKAGQKVRIREGYETYISGFAGENREGTEFVVTRVVQRTWENDALDRFYVTGDPEDWGIWISWVEAIDE